MLKGASQGSVLCLTAIPVLGLLIHTLWYTNTSLLLLFRGFSPDDKLCLSDVVLWLLEQCGRPQTECRHKCMELLYECIPLLPGEH